MTDKIAEAMSEYEEYQAMLEYEYRLRRAKTSYYLAKKHAKPAVNAAYPGVAELLKASMGDPGSAAGLAGRELASRLNRFWSQIKAEEAQGALARGVPVQAKMTPPPAPQAKIVPPPAPVNDTPLFPAGLPASLSGSLPQNGDRPKPGIVLSSSGYSKVNETVLMMVRAVAPTAGQLVHFGNLAILMALIGCARGTIQNVLMNQANNTIIRDAGYEFKIVERGSPGYTEGCFVVYCVRAPRPAADIEAEKLLAEKAAMAARQRVIDAKLRELGR